MKVATITATSLALASLAAGVAANQTGRDVDDAETMQNTQSMDHMEDQASNVQTGEERRNARDVLNESEKVLQNMKREDGMDAALEQAKGVFLVPDFGRGAFVFGAAAARAWCWPRTAVTGTVRRSLTSARSVPVPRAVSPPARWRCC